MDKDDFDYRMQELKAAIDADLEHLKDTTFHDRIVEENQAALINYQDLAMRKSSPYLPDPTSQDYKTTAKAIAQRKEKLKGDMYQHLEENGRIDFHINRFFEDEPIGFKESIKERLTHPAKVAFNENAKKTLTQEFEENKGVAHDKNLNTIPDKPDQEATEKMPQTEKDEVVKDNHDLFPEKDSTTLTTEQMNSIANSDKFPGFAFDQEQAHEKAPEVQYETSNTELTTEGFPGYDSYVSDHLGDPDQGIHYIPDTGGKSDKSPEIDMSD